MNERILFIFFYGKFNDRHLIEMKDKKEFNNFVLYAFYYI